MLEETHNTAAQSAFVRDGALILYFDKAETAFVARFDLDSLAQANFEISEQSGAYQLSLRDYSGDTQTIGRFATKEEAHRALYDIVQALLNRSEEKVVIKTCKTSCAKRWFKKLLKVIAGLMIAAALMYLVLWFATTPVTPPVTEQSSADPMMQQVPGSLSELPEGEAVDADDVLSPTVSDPSAE